MKTDIFDYANLVAFVSMAIGRSPDVWHCSIPGSDTADNITWQETSPPLKDGSIPYENTVTIYFNPLSVEIYDTANDYIYPIIGYCVYHKINYELYLW